ncbi:hypothetical protein BABINDRAFT_60775 [Babjeviella inositovora NRRL Y-12698]|uniref:Mitochondrial fission process protein 1 n=1 Tax=Babjeviella inositovora NRRL Y-12698 TaxID=984486 RepID=A0A1E3QSR7_9ASCO|nr:uncharacterized protein BABINDRAFT_60775 [Babjeviella inositovora NRRL Y-12698]ODQ80731.1 hypothetical protein BABINDRAFT_60775 [Babjeviella inositovora NRRL Y-12698]
MSKTTVAEVEASNPNQLPGDIDTTDSNLRYAAYANRFRTILLASQRYVAYTSDIGELFRPVAHPAMVKAGYGISWMYILGDVSYETWKAKMRQEGRYVPGLKPWDKLPEANLKAAAISKESERDWRLVGLQRGIFQSIASMGLPAFTIHSSVRYSSILFKNSASKLLKTYGPVGVGLAVVPLLPYLFDEPVEHIVEYVFDKGEELYTGKTHKKFE